MEQELDAERERKRARLDHHEERDEFGFRPVMKRVEELATKLVEDGVTNEWTTGYILLIADDTWREILRLVEEANPDTMCCVHTVAGGGWKTGSRECQCRHLAGREGIFERAEIGKGDSGEISFNC